MNKKLGKITSAKFGRGGYQDAIMGVSLTFGGKGWGTSHFDGAFIQNEKQDQQAAYFLTLMQRVQLLLLQAKVKTLDQLVGIPVEVEFDGNVLHSFRVLTEVL